MFGHVGSTEARRKCTLTNCIERSGWTLTKKYDCNDDDDDVDHDEASGDSNVDDKIDAVRSTMTTTTSSKLVAR